MKKRPSFKLSLRLLGLFRPYRRAYATVCLFGVLVAILEMIPPKLIGRAVDMMSSGQFPLRPIALMCAAWAVIALVVQALHGGQISLANRYGERVLANLRRDLFSHLQRLSMSYFQRTHVGRIIAVMSSDLDSIRNLMIWGLNTLVANAALMVLAAVMIFQTDPHLFFATVWLAPTMSVINFFYGKIVTEAWAKVRIHSMAVGANQAENIAGVKVVAAFNRQEHNLQHYNELQRINTMNNVWASSKSGLFQPMLQWVKFAGQGIILLYGGYRVATGHMQPGSLIAVFLYWDWFMHPAVNFGVFFNEVLIAMAGAEHIFQLLDEKPEIEDRPGAVDLPEIKGHVRFDQVSFKYQPGGRKILHGVDFTVPPGSTVALVGETGSGKSTIISLLARFYQPGHGRVMVDGFDLREVRGESLQRQMAMVLQSNFLFSGSVIDNLRYARPDAGDEEIFAAARTLGCHDRFMALPEGYQTSVGERGASLSLGERQLVCLTRALIAGPRILLLDEATSALDPMTGLQVQNALKKLIHGRTAFIVTHRLSTILNADLILVIDQGRLVERGTHEELLARNGKYAELFAHSFAGSAIKVKKSVIKKTRSIL